MLEISQLRKVAILQFQTCWCNFYLYRFFIPCLQESSHSPSTKIVVQQLLRAYIGHFDPKNGHFWHWSSKQFRKTWLRSSCESNEIEYCMVEGSGVTVLQAGLQSWQTSIQLKPGLSFYLLTFFNKKIQHYWYARIFNYNL